MIGLAALALVVWIGQDSLIPRRLDTFEELAPWTAHPADGVRMSLHADRGHDGRALRLDFDFAGGGGYAIAHRPLSLDLPANYAFSLWIRGDAPPNTLEFKLIDSSGANVWWYTERDRAFDGGWHHLVIRRRQIRFAWGPRGGGALEHVAALELVITAGRGGGTGSVWFDELVFTPLPDLGPYTGSPVATANDSTRGHAPAALIDGDSLTAWRARPPGGRTRITIDFGRLREYGALSLDWEAGRRARDYDVLASDDGRKWRPVRAVRGGLGSRDDLFLPDHESRYLCIVLRAAADTLGYGLREIIVQPLDAGASRNAFFETVARAAPPGTYPRYLLGERPDWTVVGASGGHARGLIDEDGAVDAGAGAFSVEPFLWDDRLVTWHDVRHTVSLEAGDLPVPSVTWTAGDLRLLITAFTVGPPARPSLVVRYRVRNRGAEPRTPVLYLAVRPFQVNPPWQFLGIPGGVARVDSVQWTGTELRVNGDRRVVPLVRPARASVVTFDQGGIVERLRTASLPALTAVRDTFGAASAALVYPLTLAPGDSDEVAVELPLMPGAVGILTPDDPGAVTAALAQSVRRWRDTLDSTRIDLPRDGASLGGAMRSTLGWILVNRDGPAIQPGARAYARSWIRDGALIADALLRFGYADAVRDFIEWYAPHQYASGKIPCCVDVRGADPVPEHDSNGEFIYLAMEYWRHTHDLALLARMWPHVVRAVAYLDSLRQVDRSPEFRTDTLRAFFGLLPPSISHEGYSAKPMHSYWDDFWALRGFTDATTMAQVLADSAAERRFAALRDQFRHDVVASLDVAMRWHHIDYLPGAADLGDFDPTSTTIALSPTGVGAYLPRETLERTFERYWAGVEARPTDTTWDAYAGYEVRAVGAMLRLGWKDRALALLRMFLDDREPAAWNQWPEVIYREPRAPRFVGDLPHTWVGADFLRSAADLFGYERDTDSALVVGAGLDSAWLAGDGVRVRGLDTWWGPLRYTVRWDGSVARFRLQAGLLVPPGGVVVRPPLARAARRVLLDGVEVPPDSGTGVVVRRLPADVAFEY
jgi:hypothetical protein